MTNVGPLIATSHIRPLFQQTNSIIPRSLVHFQAPARTFFAEFVSNLYRMNLVYVTIFFLGQVIFSGKNNWNLVRQVPVGATDIR